MGAAASKQSAAAPTTPAPEDKQAHHLQLRGKIDKYNKQRDVSNYPGVKEAQEALVKCYRDKPERTLDCWKQADDFKQAVANAEKHFISSFS
ncbi:hypothetical protein L1887_53368 [Cichorium endivia]|nr:hypothetical protein L1887_53368 [Cichorium endivia]